MTTKTGIIFIVKYFIQFSSHTDTRKLQTIIREEPKSNTFYRKWNLSFSPQSLQTNSRIVRQLGHQCTSSIAFQLLTYHSIVLRYMYIVALRDSFAEHPNFQKQRNNDKHNYVNFSHSYLRKKHVSSAERSINWM